MFKRFFILTVFLTIITISPSCFAEEPPFLNDFSYKGEVNSISERWYTQLNDTTIGKAQDLWAKHLGIKSIMVVDLPYGPKLEMVFVPPGKYYINETKVQTFAPFYVSKQKLSKLQYWAITGLADKDFNLNTDTTLLNLSEKDQLECCETLNSLLNTKFSLISGEQFKYANSLKMNGFLVLKTKTDVPDFVEEIIPSDEVEQYHKSKNPDLLISPFKQEEAQKAQTVLAKKLGLPVNLKIKTHNDEFIEFVLIPPGIFQFGNEKSPSVKSIFAPTTGGGEKRSLLYAEKGKTLTTFISVPFYISKYELTQSHAFFGGVSTTLKHVDFFPDLKMDPSGNPKNNISWDEAMEWSKKVSEELSLSFNLPNEWQWEYCCKAGSPLVDIFGDLNNVLNRRGIGNRPNVFYSSDVPENKNKLLELFNPNPCGSSSKNQFGIHEMNGNLAEWCLNFYENSELFLANYHHKNFVLQDPSGIKEGNVKEDNEYYSRVVRGYFSNGIDPPNKVPTATKHTLIGFRPILKIDGKLHDYLKANGNGEPIAKANGSGDRKFTGAYYPDQIGKNLREIIVTGTVLTTNLGELEYLANFDQNWKWIRGNKELVKMEFELVKGDTVGGKITFYVKQNNKLKNCGSGDFEGQFMNDNKIILSWVNPQFKPVNRNGIGMPSFCGAEHQISFNRGIINDVYIPIQIKGNGGEYKDLLIIK